jgi:hypothetical protein
MVGTEDLNLAIASDSMRSRSSTVQGEAGLPVFPKNCATKEGKQCVFGVDARDEGRHCVPELDYGPFGWCYTKVDMTTWGPCSDSCPLSGRFGVLQRKMTDLSGKIKELESEVDDMPDCIQSKGGKKAPKPGAKTPPDDPPSKKKTKTGAKSGAKAPAADDDKNVKVSKSGAKAGGKTAADSFVARHREAASGRKTSAKRFAKRSPAKARRAKKDSADADAEVDY